MRQAVCRSPELQGIWWVAPRPNNVPTPRLRFESQDEAFWEQVPIRALFQLSVQPEVYCQDPRALNAAATRNGMLWLKSLFLSIALGWLLISGSGGAMNISEA